MSKEELLKMRFVSRILKEEGENIDEAQRKKMDSLGFRSRDLFSDREFKTKDNILDYEHLAKHRFIDMSTRNTAQGKIKKVDHPIHNRILWGHANNIVRRLSFEYTSGMKEMLKEQFPDEI